MVNFFILLVTSAAMIGCSTFKDVNLVGKGANIVQPITIMSYNIRIGAGRSMFGRDPFKLRYEVLLDLEPVIAAIKSVDPDVVGLQEVLGETQAAELGKALDMHYAYVPHGLEGYGSWWGVAILSKFPIQAVVRQMISSGGGNAKSILLAELDVSGSPVTVISIHKDKDLVDGNSLRKTMRRITQIETPVILIGDLNIWPTDARHEILSNRLQDSAKSSQTMSAVYARVRGTFPGKAGEDWGRRIDYIFVDKTHFEVLDAGLTGKEYWPASDHLGFYTKVKLH